MRDATLIGFVAVTVLSCASTLPPGTRAAAAAVHVDVTPVALDSRDPGRRTIGRFVYAGGIEIRGAGSRELSDLRIVSGDHLVAVSDAGHFFEAHLLFDEMERLSGLADARVIPFIGERGEVLTAGGDAEGLDLLPNGDRLVSFERDHRVWRYPADSGPPRPMPKPDAVFPPNEGMEAITRYPVAGPDAYLVGSEGGTVWLCSLTATCRETAFGALVPSGFALTALSAYGEDGSFALLGRRYDPRGGVRIAVRLVSVTRDLRGRVLDEMAMAAPLSVDNFEGLAIVPRPAGGIRIYLLSDDNGSSAQRTYLLAFDWQS